MAALPVDPALGDRHGCSCRRSTNVGIGSEDDVLKIELEQLAKNKADQHVDDDHDRTEHKEQRRFAQNLWDRRWHADDEKEEIDQIGADLLRAGCFLNLLGENRRHDHGDGRHDQIFVAEESVDHFQHSVTRRNDICQKTSDDLRHPHDDGADRHIHSNVAQRDWLAVPVRRRQRFRFVADADIFHQIHVWM